MVSIIMNPQNNTAQQSMLCPCYVGQQVLFGQPRLRIVLGKLWFDPELDLVMDVNLPMFPV